MPPEAFGPLQLSDAGLVVRVFRAGADANRSAACRQGSLDVIHAPGRLIATGDIHDNAMHLRRVVEAAGLGDRPDPAHLTLHEIIHPGNLQGGVDFSYRALARVAALKAEFPEYVHVLLGNHELSQIAGAGIVKDGVRVVEAFNEGLQLVFGEQASDVAGALAEFVRSMPLALRCHCLKPTGAPWGDILCAHSLPGLAMMQRFDPAVLMRDLSDDDYQPRTGSAHIMVWGRGYDAEQLEDLVERWGVNLFLLGHEKAENGVTLVPPNAIVLNSDHAKGVYLPIDLGDPPTPMQAVESVVPLAASHPS